MKRSAIALAVACFAGISFHSAGLTTVTSQANYLFKSDTTYYVPNAVTLSGTTTFEGGAVIKYAPGASLTVSAINCTATAYHPVIFTAKDDDSVGARVSGSTGNPNYYSYASPALNFVGNAPWTLSNFRIANAQQAINSLNYNFTLYHGQIVNCGVGITAGNCAVFLGNLLFGNVNVALNNITYLNVEAQHVTFSGPPSTPSSGYVAVPAAPPGPFSLDFQNCIFDQLADVIPGGLGALQQYQTVSGGVNGYTSSYLGSIFWASAFFSSAPFQSAGAGSYYLAVSGGVDASGLRGVGSTAIDPTLANDLQNKTTWPPAAAPPSGTTWNQNALRDGKTCAYDLGYHYDALDYLCSQVALTGGTTTLGPGVAVGFYGVSGFILKGGAITSQGQAASMNHLVWYPSVQEQPILINGAGTTSSSIFDLNQQSGVAKNVTLNFADLPIAGGRQTLFATYDNTSFPVVTLNNCQLRGAILALGAATPPSVSPGPACTLDNSLLERCTITLYNGAFVSGQSVIQNPLSVTLYNNLFWSNNISLTYLGSFQFPRMSWVINDNLFDGSSLSFGTDGNYSTLTHTHNAYFRTSSGQMAGAADVTLNNLVYANGRLGNRYIGQAASSTSTTALQGAGSRSTVSAGLSGFTQSAAQTPDPSQVNIGFHYKISLKTLVSGILPPVSGPTKILTFDFTTGIQQASFVPDGANLPGANGRGVAINGSEMFYTVVDVGQGSSSDGIHVAPYGVNGSGGSDSRILPHPRPGTGIQDLAFHNNVLYVLTGYDLDPLQVFQINPTTGAVLAGPISISGSASSGSDGFVVLPNGNFLINDDDLAPQYHEYNGATGNLVPGGLSIDTTTLGLPIFDSTGVALAPDGQSLFFSANPDQFGSFTIVQTDLAGNLISSRSICNSYGFEDLDLIFQ